MINRREFIKGILALAVIPQIPFVGVEEVAYTHRLTIKSEYLAEAFAEAFYQMIASSSDIKWFEIPTGRTA